MQTKVDNKLAKIKEDQDEKSVLKVTEEDKP